MSKAWDDLFNALGMDRRLRAIKEYGDKMDVKLSNIKAILESESDDETKLKKIKSLVK